VKMAIKTPQIVLAVVTAAFACSCGGGGSSSSGSSSNNGSGGSGGTTNNVAQLIVDAGPQSIGDADLAFTTLTVCVPGTTTCQQIDHVQVDTGSEGLRILTTANAATGAPLLTVALPLETSNGSTAFECTQFADLTYLWGPIATADIQIAGETAKAVPVQIIHPATNSPTPTNPQVPADCSKNQQGQQLTQLSDIFGLGANAIFGVGVFRQDCGITCQQSVVPGAYYSCNAGVCNNARATVQAQVQNPVALFSTDNNGVILQLPSVSASGQASATGSLIFGIGTQSNNGTGSVAPLPADPGTGNFAAHFNNVTYNDFNGPGSGHGSSFIDSGSNGYFFLDSQTLVGSGFPLPDCSSSQLQGFYCPSSVQQLSVNVIGENPNGSGTPLGSARTIQFSVGNAQDLLIPGLAAFNNLGGPNSNSFDFGLPFFFGRTAGVYFQLENTSTSLGSGPLYAF